MRIPQRKSQQMSRAMKGDDGPEYLTPEAVDRLRAELERLEKHDRQPIVEELARAIQMGDLSENAEYTDAKARLGRLDGRIFSLKERLKRVRLIQPGTSSDGRVALGATVTVEVNGKQREYRLVGPRESNPTQGRISHVSPLGSALMGHAAGDEVTVQTPAGETVYKIIAVA